MLQAHQIKGHDCSTANKATREIMGCDTALPAPRLQFEGIGLDRCPGYYIGNGEFLRRAFEIHRWREKGFLPYPGTWLEQPNLIVETLEFIDRLVTHLQESEFRKIKR